MYLFATYEGPDAHEFVSKPLPSGDKWREVGRQVQKVEVWASRMDHPGTVTTNSLFSTQTGGRSALRGYRDTRTVGNRDCPR
jgi:hypothetical protein